MMLEVEGCQKYYGEFCALDEVSFEIESGEFVSIVGQNGAGKTTLVNILTGLLKPDAGVVRFKGRNITGMGPEKISQFGIARSFQLINLFPNLTPIETLKVAIISKSKKGTRMFAPLARDKDVERQAHEIAEVFGFSKSKKSVSAKNLSQGDKKILDIASAFALHPEVILLDEPTSGVSFKEKDKIMDIMESASERIGIKAIIQVEHDLDIVFSYSDRIIALHQGKILADKSPDELRADEEIMATVGGRGEQSEFTTNHGT